MLILIQFLAKASPALLLLKWERFWFVASGDAHFDFGRTVYLKMLIPLQGNLCKSKCWIPACAGMTN
jgi:hypothetical protein